MHKSTRLRFVKPGPLPLSQQLIQQRPFISLLSDARGPTHVVLGAVRTRGNRGEGEEAPAGEAEAEARGGRAGGHAGGHSVEVLERCGRCSLFGWRVKGEGNGRERFQQIRDLDQPIDPSGSTWPHGNTP